MFFTCKSKTISFEDAKRVLVSLLTEVGDQHWSSLIASSTSASFRGLLGGMGSLNDLIICRQNSHQISDDADPRANALLSAMVNVCFEAGSRGPLSADDAAKLCVNRPLVISGSRCRQCGYSFCGSRQVLSHLAAARLLRVISDSSVGDWPVGRLLDYWHTDESEQTVSNLVRRLQASHIEYAPGDGWMRPCRSCHSNDTCVYRWSITERIIEPTDDNLTINNPTPV